MFITKIIPKKYKEKLKKREIDLIQQKIRNTEVKYKLYTDDLGKLQDKVAIVTGGSGAIGSAICFRLAMEGAIVVVAGRNIENLNSVVEQIKSNNGKAEKIQLDVTNYDDIKNKFKEIYEKFGKIDILVNNAGGSARSKWNKIIDQDIEVIDDILNVNLKGAILCCKEAR